MRYKIKPGDCTASIAFNNGLFPDTLWSAAENAELRKNSQDRHLLTPGEFIHIPAKRQRAVEGNTEKRHRFRRKGVPHYIDYRILDEANKPMNDIEYEFVVEGVSRTGRTDSDGFLHEPITPNAKQALLILSEFDEEYEIAFGRLSPIDTDEGVRSRLQSLGYSPRTNSSTNDDLCEVVKAFQENHGLDVTGKVDSKTRDQLEQNFLL